jgi:hypothetical protein
MILEPSNRDIRDVALEPLNKSLSTESNPILDLFWEHFEQGPKHNYCLSWEMKKLYNFDWRSGWLLKIFLKSWNRSAIIEVYLYILIRNSFLCFDCKGQVHFRSFYWQLTIERNGSSIHSRKSQMEFILVAAFIQ